MDTISGAPPAFGAALDLDLVYSRSPENLNRLASAPVEAELYGCKVKNPSLPGVIQSERAAGRVKDLQVIPELESILEALEKDDTH